MSFSFTRNPSVKTSVGIDITSLVTADSELVVIGRRGDDGSGGDDGSATNLVPVQIENYGDPVAAKTEADALYGVDSELSKMIVAAIKGVQLSDLANKKYPTIKAICMAHDATSSSLAACLAANISIPMPYVVQPFAITDATARSAFKSHLDAISADDRGDNAQFGSFGFMGCLDTLTNTQTAGIAAPSEHILVPWLRDAGAAQAVYEVAAAVAALCAALDVPFLPLNKVQVGGLVPPAAKSDYATSGDAGSISLGLTAGVIPLFIDDGGAVRISRTITSSRRVSGTPDSAYFDLQDFQKLYYFRKNAYVLAQQPRYANAHATDAKLKALLSEILALAKTFQGLEMFQYVEKLAQYFSVTRDASNRSAAVLNVPVNVVPGFHNKGIGLVGTTQFDSFVIQ